jgi:hypothetical protein
MTNVQLCPVFFHRTVKCLDGVTAMRRLNFGGWLSGATGNVFQAEDRSATTPYSLEGDGPGLCGESWRQC